MEEAQQYLKKRMKIDPVSGCWEWQPYRWDGYGIARFRKKKYKAHRLSFEAFVAPIPDGLCVCHTCDNRRCINPEHLWLGTHKENMLDKEAKNRGNQTKGADNINALLGEAQVLQVIQLLNESNLTQTQIGERFGVSQPYISDIKTGRTWRYLR